MNQRFCSIALLPIKCYSERACQAELMHSVGDSSRTLGGRISALGANWPIRSESPIHPVRNPSYEQRPSPAANLGHCPVFTVPPRSALSCFVTPRILL